MGARQGSVGKEWELNLEGQSDDEQLMKDLELTLATVWLILKVKKNFFS